MINLFKDENNNPKGIEDLNLNDITKLIESEFEESAILEFKSVLDDAVKKKLSNIIVSFANENGGWLIIGISDDKKLTPIERKDFEQIISNLLSDSTSPIPLFKSKFIEIEDKEKGILVLYIPEGNEPPYFSKGKVYRRYGSNSIGVKEVTDRYYIDKLYDKSKNKIKIINEFCKREIELINHRHLGTPVYKELGKCSIYIIPKTFYFDNQYYDPRKLAEVITTEASKEQKIITKKNQNLFNVTFPLHETSCSLECVIFRQNDVLDFFNQTLVMEQYFNGFTKFHFPLAYWNKDKIKQRIFNDTERINDFSILKKFRLVDGKKLWVASI